MPSPRPVKLWGYRIPGFQVVERSTLISAARGAVKAQTGRRDRVDVVQRSASGLSWRTVAESTWRAELARVEVPF